MRPLLSALLLLTAAAVPVLAHADTITYTYNITGTPNADSAYQRAGTGTFSYQVDTAPSTISAGAQSYQLSALNFTFNSTVFTLAGEDPTADPATAYFDEFGNFVGLNYTGSACVSRLRNGVCSDYAYLTASPKNGGYEFTSGSTAIPSNAVTDGTLSALPAPLPTANAVTPEPSSLILLGTGALGILGAARRRFFTA